MAITDRRSGSASPSSLSERKDGVTTGLAAKRPVRVVATANITLAGLQTIDGVTLVADERVLATAQSTAADNGIWVASSGNWTRATDFDGSLDVVSGTFVFVTSGTVYARSIWAVSTADDITVGTTSLAFVNFHHIGSSVQAWDADLQALASNSTNGLWARTGAGTGAARTIAGTTNEVTVTNGDGVSGNPVISLPSTINLASKIVTNATIDGVRFFDSYAAAVAATVGSSCQLIVLENYYSTVAGGFGVWAKNASAHSVALANIATADGFHFHYTPFGDVELPAMGGRGDGGVDTKAILDAAIVFANGRTIHAPAGAYHFNSACATATVPVSLRGDGSAQSTSPAISLSTKGTTFVLNFSASYLITIDNSTPSSIEGIMFVCSGASQPMTAGGAIKGTCSTLGAGIALKIRNCAFVSLWDGVWIERPSGCTFENNITVSTLRNALRGTTSGGFEAGLGTVRNNIFAEYGTNPPAVIYSELGYAKISENYMVGGEIGIHLNIPNGYSAGGFEVFKNQIEEQTEYGVLAQATSGGTASMLMIDDNEFSNIVNTAIIAFVMIDQGPGGADWLDTPSICDNVFRSNLASTGKHIWAQSGINSHVSRNRFYNIGANSPYAIQVTGFSSSAGIKAPFLVDDNTFNGTFGTKYDLHTTVTLRDSGITFALLPTSCADGSRAWVSDGAAGTSPLTGSSTGSFAIRRGSAWASEVQHSARFVGAIGEWNSSGIGLTPSGQVSAGGFLFIDTGGDHSAIFSLQSNLTANRTVGLTMSDANISVALGSGGTVVYSGANSNLTSFSALASINGGQLAGFRNLLINADGRLNQRAPASNADNTYGHDRWVVLTQTGTIAVSTVSDAENGTPRMWRLTQSQAAAQRMGYAQWIEGTNCKHLRGKSVTLSGRIRFSLNAALRYAVCEWTGTEDTPGAARDIVNDWTNATFTAGNFFKSTTFNVLGVGTITPSAATLTDLTALTVTVGSSANNLVVFLWTEGTAAQNATLDGVLQLEQGSVATSREYRHASVELDLCRRYCHSYTPTSSSAEPIAMGQCISTTQAIAFFRHHNMRAKMTSITVANASSFNLASSAGAPIACTALAYNIGGTEGTLVLATVAAGLTAGNATFLFPTNTNAQIVFEGAEI